MRKVVSRKRFLEFPGMKPMLSLSIIHEKSKIDSLSLQIQPQTSGGDVGGDMNDFVEKQISGVQVHLHMSTVQGTVLQVGSELLKCNTYLAGFHHMIHTSPTIVVYLFTHFRRCI
jgi:hypothetical protein